MLKDINKKELQGIFNDFFENYIDGNRYIKEEQLTDLYKEKSFNKEEKNYIETLLEEYNKEFTNN